MELIPINESKLKIMLDESDMRELNICDEADCADSETRHAIRNILELARDKIGFNTDGSEIFVQLYTSRSGGCELFVTKGAPSTSLPEVPARSAEKPRKKRETASGKTSNGTIKDISVCPPSAQGGMRTRHECMIFSFESLRDICSVCKVLAKQKRDIISSVYLGEDGSYYLVLENISMSAYMRLDSLSFLYEFGKRERANQVNTYLYEHGKLICLDDAIRVLADF